MEVKGLKETEEAVDNLRDRFSDLEDEVDQMYINYFYDSKKARKLRGFFIDGMSIQAIAKQTGTNFAAVQRRVYGMYCDFYDNDGINPTWRQVLADRRKMQGRAKEAVKWKTLHSQSTGK